MREPMQLIADRFVVIDESSALDLATGERVVLIVTSAGGVTEQRRWLLDCERLQKLHQAGSAWLVDYGAVGESQRFEAWDGRPGVAPHAPMPAPVERPAVRAIAELFECAEGVRPRVVAMWGLDAAGTRLAVGELARVARVSGFVPLAASLAPDFVPRLTGRSLFVIDERERGAGWRVLLQIAPLSPRPHVVLFIGHEEVAGVDGLALAPAPVDQTIDSRRYGGRQRRVPAKGTRAAEPTVAYGANPPAVPAAPAADCEWPAPGELASLRRRVEAGIRLVQEGRHAPGERLLRQAIGGLTRRGDAVHAGEGGLALAAMLLKRGRIGDARTALTAAGACWQTADDPSRLIDVAIGNGTAWIELARLDEAECALTAAMAAARSLGDRRRSATAALALARVLFWRGRYEDADHALAAIDGSTVGEPTSLLSAVLASAVAVGRRHLDRAVSLAVDALASAERHADPGVISEAARALAFAHLAVGDPGASEHDVTIAVAAARRAHDPLAAARARLVRVEAIWRSGRHADAVALLKRVDRSGSPRLPPIVQARADLLRDLLKAPDSAEDIVRRHVASTGLAALTLFVRSNASLTTTDSLDPTVGDLVDLLDLCQLSQDELAVLTEVCRRIRKRVSGVATAFVCVEGAGCHLLVTDGGRVDLAIANRAVTAGTTILPHRCDDRLEAAAPVRYGGRVIGALVARWSLGTLHELSKAASLLTAAAAASAPVLSAVLTERRRSRPSALDALLGASDLIADVRRAVERAAPAPFAVLVEGESGSGKELVARALHRAGPRRDRPFCTLNCAALPDDLVEAELFGHARGAFTGAVADRTGVFEEAHTGTLFLDEVGELAPRAQAKLLRVIQEGELRRIGENVSRRIDVRIVSATNRDLRQDAAGGRFRLDLLYRLDVVRITVPPLRERGPDIAMLAEHVWQEAAVRVGSRATLASATVAALGRYPWPGNVRELQNVLAALAVRSPRRGVIPPSALGPQFADAPLVEASRLDEARRTFEERFVRAALVRAGGHRTRAAQELGVTRQGLTKLLARLGIREPAAGPPPPEG